MMKKSIFAAVSCAVLFFSSCSTLTKTAAVADVQSVICQYPTVADLEVKDRVEKTMTWSFMPFHLGEPSLEVAKGNLIAETLGENDADIMLEPQFEFTRKSYGQRRLVLRGIPAKLKNFRSATEKDLEALKVSAQPNERRLYNVSKSGFFNKLFK